MATKGDPDQPGRWKGDEVEDQPADEAERAADRAEGNEPVSAADEAARREQRRIDAEVVDARRQTKRSSPPGDPDEKIAEAAEGHQDREVSAGLPPRGKL
jgi:hypothetical protein